eukprot:3405433-Lingulodinium_polyedra.AAC.1
MRARQKAGARVEWVLQAVAAADGRCDRIIVFRFENVAQRRGRIDRPPSQRFANRMLAYSMRASVYWRA